MLATVGADINATDVYGGNALHMAVTEQCCDCVSILISLGCDIHARGIDDETPLDYGASFGKCDCIPDLVAGGATGNQGICKQGNEDNIIGL